MHYPLRSVRSARRILVVLAALSTLAAGCSHSHHTTATTSPAVPSKIIATPAGLVGGTSESPTRLWVLAGTPSAKALHLINPETGSVEATVQVSNQAESIAESSSNVIALGLAGPSSGAVQLYDGNTGDLITSIPIGAPSKAVAFGSDGTLYVLNGSASSTSVTIIDTATKHVTGSIGAPLHAVGLAVDSTQNYVYTADGTKVDQLPLTKGQASASFPTTDPGISLALSSNGQFLYVLKGNTIVDNVGVLSTATESMIKVLSAAANSVSIALSRDGRTLYDFVGTPSTGNVQVISLPPGTY
jgi:serine/threonine-protein kinase